MPYSEMALAALVARGAERCKQGIAPVSVIIRSADYRNAGCLRQISVDDLDAIGLARL
jgi:hypothetical protein